MLEFRSKALLCTLVVVFGLLSVSTASADVSGGLRVGFSSSPDQVVMGQLELSPIAEHVFIIPSGELGLGDHATTLAFNGDVQYRFRTRSEVLPYAGGGLTVYYVNVDGGGSDTNLGVCILGGIYFNRTSSTPMFVDAKAGLTDEVPDWRFVFGLNFR